MSDQSSSRPLRGRWLVPVSLVAACLLGAVILTLFLFWFTNWSPAEQVAIDQLTSEGRGGGYVGYDWEVAQWSDQEGPPGNFVMKALLGEDYASHAVTVDTYGRSAEMLATTLIHLRKLQTIDLQDCEFNEEVARILADLPELQTIRFARMSPSAECLAILAQTTQVRELGLLDTQVTDAQLAAIGEFSSLKEIFIVESTGTDEGLSKLGQLRSLEYLTIHKMPQITDEGVAHLKNLTKLKTMLLPMSQVTGRSLEIVTQMPDLESLEMTCLPSEQDATLATSEIWPQVPTLSSIYLDAPCINDEDLATMAKMPNLSDLYLANPSITDRGVAKLAHAPELFSLTLLGTHISDKGIRPLAQAPELFFIEVSSDRKIRLKTVGQAEVEYERFFPKGPHPHLHSPYEDW